MDLSTFAKWAEDERRESDARFRLIFERSPDAMFLMDPHDPEVPWRIVDCNDVACRMNGYTRDELVGQGLHLLDPGRAAWVDDSTFLERLRRESTIHGVTPHRRKDGTLFFIEFSTSLLTVGGRELVLGIDRDLTERLQSEEALQRAKDELELRVEQRTAELAHANEQLRAELARREVAERRLAAQYAISRILAEAPDFATAAPRMLQVIAESQGWQLAQLWHVDAAAGLLRWSAAWQADTTTAATFVRAGRETTFAPGVGLLGEVWARGAPWWLDDLAAAPNFPRLRLATAAGLRSGFAFPIRSDAEVLAVMEFFSVEARPADQALLQMVGLIGNQSGQFIDRRRAEQAVRASETRKSAILAASLDCIITMDHAGRVVEWNPAAEAVFGYAREAALGHDMAELIIPPDLRDAHRRGLARYLSSGEHAVIGRRIELRGLRAGGTEFPIELTISRIPSDGPPLFTGFVRDISDRKQAEQSIRFQAHLLDTVEQAVVATDLEGTIIYWNRYAAALYGWPAAEAIGRNILETITAMSAEPQAAALMERLGRGQSWSGELVIRRRDGTLFPALVTDTPVYDAAGTLIGIVRIAIDITERKRAEERARFLAEASAVLASSLDEQAILDTLAQHAVPRFADSCVVELFTEHGRVEQPAAAHVDPLQTALVLEAYRRAAQDSERPSSLARDLADGESYLLAEVPDALLDAAARDVEHLALLRMLDFCSWISVPLVVQARTLGLISFATTASRRRYDVTDLRLAEDLARRAALAVENARLYCEAQEAIEARDTFLSIASHELRTPLTGLLGNVQLIQMRATREQTFNERDRRALRIVHEQGHRLALLVDEMLDISRIERGLFHVERRPMDLAALAARLVEQMEPALRRHTITLTVPDQPVAIQGDEQRLEQVLHNLLNNAVKYSPMGGPVTVRVEQRAGQASLEVSDQGLGIPAAEQVHLFQRFYRVGNAQRSHISGFGLGLYLVKEIVSRHDGTVEVRSVEGQGSTFTVCIPLDRD